MHNPNMIHISINGGANKGKTIVSMLIKEALEARGIKPIIINGDGDLNAKIEAFKSNPEGLIKDFVTKIFDDMDTKVVIEDMNRCTYIVPEDDSRTKSVYVSDKQQ